MIGNFDDEFEFGFGAHIGVGAGDPVRRFGDRFCGCDRHDFVGDNIWCSGADVGDPRGADGQGRRNEFEVASFVFFLSKFYFSLLWSNSFG